MWRASTRAWICEGTIDERPQARTDRQSGPLRRVSFAAREDRPRRGGREAHGKPRRRSHEPARLLDAFVLGPFAHRDASQSPLRLDLPLAPAPHGPPLPVLLRCPPLHPPRPPRPHLLFFPHP